LVLASSKNKNKNKKNSITAIATIEIFILTIMKTKVQMKVLDFGIFHTRISFIGKQKMEKTKKHLLTEMVIRTGEEIGFPNFILKKTRISVHLQLQLNSLHTRVVSLEPWIQTIIT
jgi:hypothetical protein